MNCCQIIINFLLCLFLLCSSDYASADANQLHARCATFAEALQRASQLRGLELRQPVSCQAVDRGEYRALLKKEAAAVEGSRLQRHAADVALKLVGVLPEGYDSTHCLVNAAPGDVQAFYHPESGAVIVPSWRETPTSILVHEAVHALQDQYADLAHLRKAANTTTDRALAFAALVEGDAIDIQESFSGQVEEVADLQPPPAISNTNECTVPVLIRKQYEFPYDYGPLFVRSIKSRAGLGMLNRQLRSPPRTTRQILYPKEFGTGELNSPPQPPLRLPADYRSLDYAPIYRDTLGEYSLRALLRETLSTSDGIHGARGWRGDWLTLFNSQRRHSWLAIWQTVWQSKEQASEFRELFSRMLAKRFNTTIRTHSPAFRLGHPNYALIELIQRGEQVVFSVATVPPDL